MAQEWFPAYSLLPKPPIHTMSICRVNQNLTIRHSRNGDQAVGLWSFRCQKEAKHGKVFAFNLRIRFESLTPHVSRLTATACHLKAGNTRTSCCARRGGPAQTPRKQQTRTPTAGSPAQKSPRSRLELARNWKGGGTHLCLGLLPC